MVTVLCNGKRFSNIEAIFLDKDGTLADVATYLKQLGTTQATLMEQLLPGSHELILKALGIHAGDLSPSGLLAVGSRQETILGTAAAAAIAGCPWISAVDVATTTLATADQHCSPKAAYTPLLPGVKQFLQRLKQANLKVIMVSADAQENLEQFVQQHQLQPYFDHLQGVSQRHPTKTAPEFLTAACHAVGVTPRQGVVIGDAASDLRMAASARGFIGYLGGWQPRLSATDIIDSNSSNHQPSVDCEFVTEFSQIALTV
ncbi:HAD family hydrolase [Leptolyngbya sp. Heron Island J]|uniref:HAD family hydrolase n=1 Tax=Leptolyngbya sp. Heron Island J TaxID=1385935 RepID=UPI0004282FDC|nr:HAD-IA family hydrolase [Leptolyngbya sp. Heron Island J]